MHDFVSPIRNKGKLLIGKDAGWDLTYEIMHLHRLTTPSNGKHK